MYNTVSMCETCVLFFQRKGEKKRMSNRIVVFGGKVVPYDFAVTSCFEQLVEGCGITNLAAMEETAKNFHCSKGTVFTIVRNSCVYKQNCSKPRGGPKKKFDAAAREKILEEFKNGMQTGAYRSVDDFCCAVAARKKVAPNTVRNAVKSSPLYFVYNRAR